MGLMGMAENFPKECGRFMRFVRPKRLGFYVHNKVPTIAIGISELRPKNQQVYSTATEGGRGRRWTDDDEMSQ